MWFEDIMPSVVLDIVALYACWGFWGWLLANVLN